ncbi:hypothetical protein [Legionella sp. 29fVS95]|uniref:hypothetical protein n=1 Tax=Legionella sp. 29fVS95 TaxID=3402813 RepID=UPI003AF47178
MPSEPSNIERIRKSLEEAKGPGLHLSFFSPRLDSFCADLIGKFLKSNTTVTDLNLYGNSFNSASTLMLVKGLRRNTALIKLDLGSNKFKDPFVLATLAEAVNSHPNLVLLELGESEMGGNATFLLSRLETRLSSKPLTLVLNGNNITDKVISDSAEALENNASLTEIDLSENEITSTGASILAKVLKKNNTLKGLNLFANAIDYQGVLALFEALRVNRTLTTIELSSNKIYTSQDNPVKPGARIAEVLMENSSLTSVWLNHLQLGNENILPFVAVIRDNTSLTELGLEGNAISVQTEAALVEALEDNIYLTKFDLDTEMRPQIDSLLARNQSLQEMYIQPLLAASEKGDTAEIIRLLMQMKTAFPEIDSANTKLPKQLVHFYWSFVDELVDSLFVSQGLDDRARYSLILELLKNRLNEENYQKIVRACVKGLRRLNGAQESYSDFEPHQSNQFVTYRQLRSAAQRVLSEMTDTNGQPKETHRHRHQLFRALCHQESYTPLATQYLLAAPEVRAQLNLNEHDKPILVDAVILATEDNSTINLETDAATLVEVEPDRRAQLMLYGYTEALKKFSTNATPKPEQVLRHAVDTLITELGNEKEYSYSPSSGKEEVDVVPTPNYANALVSKGVFKHSAVKKEVSSGKEEEVDSPPEKKTKYF